MTESFLVFRNETGRDKNEISKINEALGAENTMLRFLTGEENGLSIVDRLHQLQHGKNVPKPLSEHEILQRSLTPDSLAAFMEESMEKKQVMSTGDYWNEASRRQTGFPKTKRRSSSITDAATIESDAIPLDVLFTICSEKHGWLRIQDKKVTFLHASDSSVSDKSVKFVVGCYLAYLGNTDSDKSPISNQSPKESHWKVHNKTFVAPQHPSDQLSQIMYSIGLDTNQIKNYGGPAQKRYAQYFLSILYSSCPPPELTIALRIDRVIVSGLEQIRRNLRINRVLSQKWRDQVLHPVLVVYQRGQLKWKKIVPVKDSVVDFSPGVDVVGDSVVGIWFVKDCVSTNEPPVVAFSFHSAFMEAGVVQLSSADLSLHGIDITGLLDGEPTTISMKLTLSLSPVPVAEVEQWEPAMEHSTVREQWLAKRGGLPEIYATVREAQSKKSLESRDLNQPRPAPPLNLNKQYEKASEVLNQDAKAPAKRVENGSLARSTSIETPRRKIVSPFSHPGKIKAPPPPPPKRRNDLSRRSSSFSSTPRQKQVSKTKPLYWSITTKKSGTVWSELQPQESVDKSRLSLLEDLFCKDDPSKQKIPENDPVDNQDANKKGTAVAVSIGRANNVSIMMTRFKRFIDRLDDLCKAILTGDEMMTEELVLLSQIGPTEDEARELKGHKKDELSEPEKILLALTVVPRLRVKASCQVAMRSWDERYSDAVNMLETTKAACQQIRHSQRLRSVFTSILSVGNTMNRGTNRGNAGGIKIDSLSKLWDTRVSKNAMTKETKSKKKLQRAGSVPTAISQCLERDIVEEKIQTLLDFVAVLVHDHDRSKGLGHCDRYLLMELESLEEAVAFLEDGVTDLLAEIDKSFALMEKEFQNMTGKTWSSINSAKPESINDLKILHSDVFLEDQHSFLKSSYHFLITAGGARNFLKQEVSVSDQYLKSTVEWLGEGNGDNPKLHLKQLLAFAQHFDQSYKKLKS